MCLLGLIGCASPPRHAQDEYPLGIEYDLNWLDMVDEPVAPAVLARDFAEMRRLGFNTIFAQGNDAADWPRVRDAAERNGLRVAWTCPELESFIRDGTLASQSPSVEAIVTRCTAAQKSPDMIWDLASAWDQPTASRMRQIADALRAARPAPVFGRCTAPALEFAAPGLTDWTLPTGEVSADAAPRDAAPAGRAWMTMALPPAGDAADARDHARWLATFHECLATGHTAGLLLVSFRCAAEPSRGLVDQNLSPSAATAATVKRILARAANWGAHLRGLSPQALDASAIGGMDLRTTLFVGRKRRFLLVANPSSSEFVHTQMALTEAQASAPTQRAVRVPADERALAAEVVVNRHGRLTFDLNLAPGDAALYELF